ncbi:MAG: hypothetical protein JJT76_19890 [Clostridiaceae bacterium]|nr:hypothetical protein [Clostridiaceae bacterium]
MIKRNKKILSVIMMFIVLLYIFYSYPRYFEESYIGLEYRLGDSEYQREVSVEIKGWYRRRIFRSDNFKGSMTIDDKTLYSVELDIGKDETNLFGREEDTSRYRSFGAIASTKMFEEFTILVYERAGNHQAWSWSSEDGLMISVPADNRERALDLSKRLIGNQLGEGDVVLE